METKSNTLSKTKITKPILLILIVVVALLGVAGVVASKASPPSSAVINTKGPTFGIYINPQSSNVTTGSQFNASVYANLGTTSVQSISAYVHYDPTILRLDSADQAGVNPSFTVVSRCSSIDGCKKEGDVVFVAGFSSNGTISPQNNLLVGNLKFTALKTGTATVALDPDVHLTGFVSPTASQSTLDTRQLSNGTFNIIKAKGKRR